MAYRALGPTSSSRAGAARWRRLCLLRAHFTCFTGTKVQLLTQQARDTQPAVRYYVQSAGGTKALALPVEDAFILKAAEALYVELDCPDPACTPRYIY